MREYIHELPYFKPAFDIRTKKVDFYCTKDQFILFSEQQFPKTRRKFLRPIKNFLRQAFRGKKDFNFLYRAYKKKDTLFLNHSVDYLKKYMIIDS